MTDELSGQNHGLHQATQALDDMDRLLLQLPGEPPPTGLSYRILSNIRARQRRTNRLRIALSTVLAGCGLWLVYPLLNAVLQGLASRSAALPAILDWYEIAQQDMVGFLASAGGDLTSFQEGFTASLGTPAWAGMLVLVLSAILVIGYILPRAGDHNGT
jgi:hypothetical protein